MKPLRVFLANCGSRTVEYFLTTPPMGILYLAGYLRSKRDVDLRLVDQRAENCSVDELADTAIRFEADVVGLSSITTSSHMLADLTTKIRQGLPNALIVLGGPHPTAFGAEAMVGTQADAAVVGEGEVSFELVIRAHLDGANLSQVPGLIWRDKDGHIVTNTGRVPLVENLDDLPFPAYDLINVKDYWRLQSLAPIGRRTYISLVSSRGCPYQCMWCHDVFGKKHRAHSPERIVDEIQQYQRQWGMNEVEFLDDVFNLSRKRVIAFCELAQRKGVKFKIAFPNAVRTDILTQNVVDALVDTGLYYSAFALETASPRLQEFTGKHLSVPKFLEGVEMAVRRGVFSNGLAMLGFPTETEDELKLTIDTMVDSPLHIGSFFTVTPFPKTRLYELVKETHPGKLDGLSYANASYAAIQVNCSAMPDEVLFAHQRRANLRFFLKPSRVARILRDFPQRRYLPTYLPSFLMRATKGMFRRSATP
ncbi:MAG: B12-binding domain-containing radical SAM protein [Phycisphaerae bacterium]|nr:B12-binding domain-containing radical SAM protein [Phycisphaerae bacterium]